MRAMEFIGFMAIAIIALFVIMVASRFLTIAGGYADLAQKTVSAPNFEKNYEWFKQQETALDQIANQICFQDNQLVEFKQTYGSNSSAWTKTDRDQYNDLTFVRNGYVSKYNSLASEYNARRSSFIRSFGRDATPPSELAQYYENYCR